MIINQKIRLTIIYLLKKGLRTYLTVISIAIGICSVSIINITSTIGKTDINDELNSFGLSGVSVSLDPKQTSQSLDNGDLNYLRSLSGVSSAAPMITLMGDMFSKCYSGEALAWGIDDQHNLSFPLKLLYGRQLNKADIKSQNLVCIVDTTTAQKIKHRDNIVGSKIDIEVKNIMKTYTVVGVISKESGILTSVTNGIIPTIIYTPYTCLEAVSGDDLLPNITVTLNNTVPKRNANNYIIDVISKHKNLQSGVIVNDIVKQRAKLSGIIDVITIMLSGISGISLLVSGIGVMTIMLISVNERVKEIGIKKALGARSVTIMIDFLMESLFLSFMGTIVGIIISAIFYLIIVNLTHISAMLTPLQLFTPFIIAISTGIIFGVFPAIKACALKPVDALKR